MKGVVEIAEKVPFFKEKEKKARFLSIVGALSLRIISLRKASELLDLDEKTLLNMLESTGFFYSFLEKEDIEIDDYICYLFI